MSSRHPQAEALAERVEKAVLERMPPEMAAETKFWREFGRYDEWVTVSVMEEPEIHNYPFFAHSPQLKTDREIDAEFVADDLVDRAKREWERRRATRSS